MSETDRPQDNLPDRFDVHGCWDCDFACIEYAFQCDHPTVLNAGPQSRTDRSVADFTEVGNPEWCPLSERPSLFVLVGKVPAVGGCGRIARGDTMSETRPREYRQPCPRCQSQRIVCDTLQIDLETTKRAQECLSCDLRGPSADDEQGATREWNKLTVANSPSGTRPDEPLGCEVPTIADIRAAIGFMRTRLESEQGGIASNMCRLSLPMAETLMAARDMVVASADEARDILNGCNAVDLGVAWTTNLHRVCQLAGGHAEWKRRALAAEATRTPKCCPGCGGILILGNSHCGGENCRESAIV